MWYSCRPRGQLTAVCKTVHNIVKVRITRNITEFSYTFVHKMPWLENFLQTLYVHCFRFILLIVTCYFTTMLVDFLNIKHFSPSEDVKCVSWVLHPDQETVLWYWFLNICSYFIRGSFCPRHPVFGFVSVQSCRIISHLEAGPGSAIMWLNITEEVGRVDTELIIQNSGNNV